MNPLSSCDILSVWEQGHGRLPLEKALILARFAKAESSDDELAAIPVVERDLMLLDLREQTLGPRLNTFVVCPGCNQELEFPLEIREIREKLALPLEAHEAAIGEFLFHLRRPSSADLAAAGSANDLPRARLALAKRCIRDARLAGTAMPVDEIPMPVISRLADYLDEAENPADILIDVHCPACARSWQVLFDIASYFYSELTVLARRLLEEVHVLASNYGWSERDILAMPPGRRRFYLERVQ
ncbi:MAG: phage baseplate protein [Acidobacteria bacterium]|nr:phage baseplate protein [Acidobacteriota bacterium]